MKIIFFGFGKVGFLCLNELIKNDFSVVGVVPRSSDLGYTEDRYSVRNLAAEHSLKLYDHDDVGLAIHDGLCDVDYLISVQYDRILKNDWLALPTNDSLNLHFSLLPKLRGCYPTKWAIIEGINTGVTLHSIDLGIDTGDIFDQISVPVHSSDTDQSLYGKLSEEAFNLFCRNTFHLKLGKFPKRIVQSESDSSYHPKELPFGGFLDCSWDLNFCERFLRAFYFPPFPPALFKINNLVVGFPPPCKTSHSKSHHTGHIEFIEDRFLSVNCLNGTLFFDTVWYEKKFISITEFSKFWSKKI